MQSYCFYLRQPSVTEQNLNPYQASWALEVGFFLLGRKLQSLDASRKHRLRFTFSKKGGSVNVSIFLHKIICGRYLLE